MYKKHRIVLFLFSVLAGVVCCLFELRITAIASDVISVVSISSALYLAAYAGIQASTDLRERLKEPDSILQHRTQRFVLNSYFKVALVLNVATIISVCVNSMVVDRIVQFEVQSRNCMVEQLADLFLNKPVQKQELSTAWLWAKLLLNFSSTSLFIANIIQMCFIGKFVVNRIAFDK